VTGSAQIDPLARERRAARLARALGVGALLALASLAVSVVLAWRADVDENDHERYARAIRRAEELDARLDEEIAKSRLGIVTHYDGLVRVWDTIEANASVLAEPPESVVQTDGGRLTRRFDAYRAALGQKKELVERFKSEQAVLRNSIRAFPHNAERVLAALAGADEHTELARALETLEHDVLLLVLAPSRDRASAARCDLVAFGETMLGSEECPGSAVDRSRLDAVVGAQLGMVIHHARVVVDRNSAVESIVERFMNLPVATAAEEMRETYAQVHAAAVARARERLVLVFVLLVAALALAAAYIIVRLTSTATALREATSKLEVALAEIGRERDREVELANLKTQFVSMTSHEFRTPLSVILSSSELIEAYGERWNAEKRNQHLVRIQDAAKAMSRMLDGVLLIGRAQAGMLKLNPAPLALGDLASGVIDEVRSMVGRERKLDFVDESAKDQVWMDEKLLRHILTNLLSNAFKYSPDESTVRFSVRHDGKQAVFEVRDEGIGIPEDERGQLFEAFHRMSNATTIPGTGLGLAVVKNSVDVHGGTIEVESEVGKGTRFIVRVPYIEEAA
jgi:signal transduction histidine kinase